MVYRLLRKFSRVHSLMMKDELFTKYPMIVSGIMKRLFENPNGPEKAWTAINESCAENHYYVLKLLVDAYNMVRAL